MSGSAADLLLRLVGSRRVAESVYSILASVWCSLIGEGGGVSGCLVLVMSVL